MLVLGDCYGLVEAGLRLGLVRTGLPQQQFPQQAMSDYFTDCEFDDCVLKPEGTAANAIQFLSELYQDEASRPMMNDLLKKMRKGFKAPQLYSWPTHV